METQESLQVLIDRLHRTVQSLENLTDGEIDAVADHEGRPFLLRRAQEQLRRNEAAKQAAILNALPARIALLDIRGRIITVNDAWRQFADTNALQDQDACVGVDYLSICAGIHGREPSTAQEAVAGMTSVLTGKATTFSLKFAHDSGNEQRWFLMTVTHLVDDHADGAIVMYTNITESMKAEQGLRDSAKAMFDLDRRKDEFLAMLGHELRNPLAPIVNAVEILRLQKDDDPMRQRARGVIERQARQLTRLVDDLLEISRINTGKIEITKLPIFMSSIIERAVETVQPLMAPRRHVLTISQPPLPVRLNADAARLEQVIVNLLTNAAKYTTDGGHVWIDVLHEGDMVEVRVRDTGIGIAPDLLPHVFDLFTQAERSLDRSQGGLGIGLCLVKRMVELHGGTAEAHSTLGKESEFIVRLPTISSDAQQAVPVATEPSGPGAARLRVLVVDDNVDLAQTLALLLETAGHDVRIAYEGPAAMQAASDCWPDVMLLDIGLPGMNGHEVARHIRQQPLLSGITLVAMTGYGQQRDRQSSQEAGFDHFLVKPADFDDVLRILATVARNPA